MAFIKGKMADKAEENAGAVESEEEEIESVKDYPSDRESEEGADFNGEGAGPSSSAASPSSKKTTKVAKSSSAPKKKKVASGGMQIPEFWPWEEAKELFIHPDVVKGDELEVRHCVLLSHDMRKRKREIAN